MWSLILLTATPATAVQARYDYVTAYNGDDGGEWYRGYDNDSATLAWGESYVMMSLASMYRATGDPSWLDALAWHADAALAQRDDARGVTDYRGESGPCWRNTHYQSGGEGYCYVVHSGMILAPMVSFARLVAADGLQAELAYDGRRFAEKADTYVAAAEDAVAWHDEQWDDAGFYAFRSDASFLAYAGVDLPLNQSNAMGRVHLLLHDVTGDPTHLDRATRLAERFQDQITTASDGALLWNYWGGPLSGNGEDISHAALNVDFAAMAAERAVVFDADDMAGFATTFLTRINVDDQTFSDAINGGSTNTASYLPQVGRWLRLAPTRAGVYTAVRDLYDRSYPAGSTSSGSILLGQAMLAEFELSLCAPFFYLVDWTDEDADDDTSWRTADAYGANVLTRPVDTAKACMVPVDLEIRGAVSVQQWDGDTYHTVSRWLADTGETSRHIPYDTRWPFTYWEGGQLFQFADDSFSADTAIRVRERADFTLPQIDPQETPPALAIGETLTLDFTGSGDEPLWWALDRFPTGARIDPSTGTLTWVATVPGEYPLVVTLENGAGQDALAMTIAVEGHPSDTGQPPDTAAPDTGDTGRPDDDDTPDSDPTDDTGATLGPPTSTQPGECGCSASTRPLSTVLLSPLILIGALCRRRRAPRVIRRALPITALPACFGLTSGAGPVVSPAGAPDGIAVSAGIDVISHPTRRNGKRGIPAEVLDTRRPYHFGVGYGLRGQFGADIRMLGPELHLQGHLHVIEPLSLRASAGLSLVELGVQQGHSAVGLTSPFLEAGLRLHTLGAREGAEAGLWIDAAGLGGYALRPGDATSYPYWGGLLRLTYGIQP